MRCLFNFFAVLRCSGPPKVPLQNHNYHFVFIIWWHVFAEVKWWLTLTIYILFLFCLYFVFILSSFCLYLVFILSLFCLHFVFILCLFCVYFVFILPLFCLYFVFILQLVFILSLFCLYFYFILSLFCNLSSFCLYFVFILYLFCLYSVFILSLFCLHFPAPKRQRFLHWWNDGLKSNLTGKINANDAISCSGKNKGWIIQKYLCYVASYIYY